MPGDLAPVVGPVVVADRGSASAGGGRLDGAGGQRAGGGEPARSADRALDGRRLVVGTMLDVVDHGDRPTVRWRPHPTERRPHDVSRVLEVLRDTREHVGAILDAGQTPLVIGGDCTLTLAVLSAAVDHDPDVALLYFDGGPDLRTTADNPTGVMDSMGGGVREFWTRGAGKKRVTGRRRR